MPKLYTSETWLKNQLWVKKNSIEEVAEICGVDRATIHRWATRFKLTKASR